MLHSDVLLRVHVKLDFSIIKMVLLAPPPFYKLSLREDLAYQTNTEHFQEP